MTQIAEFALSRQPSKRNLLRWGLAGLAVTCAHAALAYGVVALAPVRERAAVAKAVTIELTPLVVSAANLVQAEVVAEEQPTEVSAIQPEPADAVEQVQPTPTTESEPVETASETSEEPLEATEITEATREIPMATTEANLAELPTELIVPVPAPDKPKTKPIPRKIEQRKPVQKTVRSKLAPVKSEKPARPQPSKIAKAPNVEKPASVSRNAARGTLSRAPKVNPSRWYAQVQAAVARRKPRGKGMDGRVSIRFVVNSTGAVVSSGIAKSSGNTVLDQAALSMVRGARLPAPPAGLGRSSHPFTIPVTFQ